jgi:sugar phosphate isomerase/epimerase
LLRPDAEAMKPSEAAHPAMALCWGSVRQANLLELASLASRHGFAEISITAGQFQTALRAGHSPAGLRDQLADLGVAIGVVDPLISALPGVPAWRDVPAAMREVFRYTLGDCIEAAKAVGARRINLAHFLGQETELHLLAEAVAAVAAAAADAGLGVSLEFIPGTGVPDLAAAREIIARSHAANAGIMFDTWHFVRSGGTLSDLDDLGANEIVELQLSDWRQPPPDEIYVPMTGRLAPGAGELPLPQILRKLLKLSPGLVISLEVFRADAADPEPFAGHLAVMTRKLLANVICP